MLSEKGVKFMETNKATIQRGDQNTFLVLNVNNQDFKIILTDDNPNNVKDVFNKLLLELKKGLFEFEIEDETEDLYHHICKEYILQLNDELQTIFQELEEYELLEK
jgi:hypothetical protein